MPRRKRVDEPLSREFEPAKSPEQREQQLIVLATDLVERRLREGTASSAETVHFLKLASRRNKLEEEKIRAETEKAKAQAQQARDMEDTKRLMTEAIQAMQTYRPVYSEEVETE